MLEGCTPWPEEFVRRYKEAGYWEGRTLGEMLDEAVAKFGSREAVVDDSGTRYTYNDLGHLSDRLALHLIQLGLEPNVRVLVQLLNVSEFAVLYFAMVKAGVIPVMALPQHRLHEMGFFAELSEARAYFMPFRVKGFDYTELAEQVREKVPSVQKIIVHGDNVPAGYISLDALLADPIEQRVSKSKLERRRPDPDEVALFLLSGGTTGLPKLIPRTHNEYIYNSKCMTGFVSFEDENYLAILPIEHNYPIMCGIQPILMKGGKFVFVKTATWE